MLIVHGPYMPKYDIWGIFKRITYIQCSDSQLLVYVAFQLKGKYLGIIMMCFVVQWGLYYVL